MEKNKGPRFGREPKKGGGEEFKHFSEHERHDIYEFCKELTNYLNREGVRNILFLDRSARPALVGVDEYWNQHYKDEKKPGFYFANPDGMEAKDSMLVTDPRAIMRLLDALLSTGSIPAEKTRTLNEATARFKEAFPKLVKDVDEPLVVFDTCSHTGGTMNAALQVLERAGFTDVRPITANEPDWHSEIQPAAVIDGEVRLTSCYPFGRHSLVSKTEDVLSKPNPENLEMGTKIREDIRRIMREGGSNK